MHQWGEDENGYREPTGSPNRRADESGTRETEHLSFRPTSARPFFSSFLPSAPFVSSSSSPPSSSPSPPPPCSSDARAASSDQPLSDLFPLDSCPAARFRDQTRVRSALAEEGWLCTNSPTWDAHFRTLSSSTLLARAAFHFAELLCEQGRTDRILEGVTRSAAEWRPKDRPRKIHASYSSLFEFSASATLERCLCETFFSVRCVILIKHTFMSMYNMYIYRIFLFETIKQLRLIYLSLLKRDFSFFLSKNGVQASFRKNSADFLRNSRSLGTRVL